MLSRRSLFKVLAASGLIVSGIAGRFAHAMDKAQVKPGHSGPSRSGLTLPDASDYSASPLRNILLAEQWEDLTDDLDCAELASGYSSLEEDRASISGEPKRQGRCLLCQAAASFQVDSRSFGCETCGSWGGPIDFYARIEGMGMTTAMTRLQDLLDKGIIQGRRAVQARVCMLMEEAAAFYHHLLCESRHGEPGLVWLKHHGLTRQSIERFRLGYAPRLPNGLLAEHLVSLGYRSDEIERAGLAFWERPKGWQVRDYHNRDAIMIPVCDGNGRCWGFLEQVIVEGKPAVSQFELEAMQRVAPNRFRRLVFPAPTWPQDFRRYEKILLVTEPIEVIRVKQDGLDSGLYIGDLAASHEDPRFRLRTALAMGERLVYPFPKDASGFARCIDHLVRQLGSCLDRVDLL